MSRSSSSSDRAQCVSYHPGHRVHWIQARKTHDEGQSMARVSATVRDDDSIRLRGQGLDESMWSHDLDSLRRYSGDVLAHAIWLPRLHVLVVNGAMFSLAASDARTPCIPDDASREPSGDDVSVEAPRHVDERG
ncbi:hypothetical protein GCM10022238_26090 [Gordonia hankookensis]